MIKQYILCFLFLFLGYATNAGAQQPLYLHYSTDNGLPTMQTYNIVQDASGFVWISTAMGVCRFNGYTFTTYTTPGAVPAVYARALSEPLQAELWLPVNRSDAAIDYLNTLYKHADTTWQHLLPNQSNYFLQPVSCTLREDEQTLWIGTWGGGAYRCTAYQTDSLQVRSFLPRKTITGIFKDRESNYWFTTLDDGVFLLSNPDVLTYTTNSGLPADDLYAVSGNNRGEVWVGTGRGSVGYLPPEKDRWMAYTIGNAESAFSRINDIAFDQSGNKWFATDGGLFFINPQSDWFVLNLTPTTSLAYSGNNHLWVGKYNFPVKINTNTGTETNTLPIKQQVNALTSTQNGTLWIGTSAGLYRNENGKNYYLGNKALLLAKPINDLCADTAGRLWIATADTGVLVKQNNSLIHISTANGLSSNTCNALFADAKNRIWVATNKGLNQITLSGMNPNTAKVITYNTLDGLVSDFVSDVWVNADSVWVATVKGLTLFRANAGLPDSVTPPIYITAFKVWNQSVPLNNAYRLQYNQNNLSIEFAGLSYRSGNKLQYLYQMESIDNAWVKTDLTTVQYPSLLPGSYVFRVAALDKWGRISAQPAIIAFLISPPFWETWYFKLLATLLIGAGIATTVYLVIRYYNDRSELQRRMVESEQMALRTQMNPHFIFNSLNAIQYFITDNDKLSANRYLSVFSTLIRKVLDNSQRSYISLEEEVEYLQLYLQIEALRFKDKFTYEINIAPQISASETGIPPMLIQPYVENALQHGLLRKTEGNRHLSISFEQPQPDVLLCAITDNGIGRVKARELASGRKGTGIGMVNPRARLAILNRLLKKPIEVKITDLYTEAHIPCGTQVNLSIPVYAV